MRDVFEEWVDKVLSIGGDQVQQARQALEVRLRRLESQLADIDDPEALRAQRARLAREVDALEASLESARAQLHAAERAAAERQRSESRALLDDCARQLRALQAVADLHLIGEVESMLQRPLDEIPPAQLSVLLSSGRGDQIRRQLAAHLSVAHEQAREVSSDLAEVRRLKSERASLLREVAATRDALALEHQVSGAVLQALLQLDRARSVRLRQELLEGYLTDAQAEATWDLPADVLSEVRDEVG